MRWLLLRLLWLGATLVGITFVTFVVVDRAPVDRAELAVERAAGERAWDSPSARDAAILQLRLRHGMVDPHTLEPAPIWRRYGSWLQNALLLRFGGPNDDHALLWQRIGAALPVTALLGVLALLVAFVVGVPLGVRMGFAPGSRQDRVLSTTLLLLAGVPEFLLATLLLLAFTAAWLQWLPAAGLRSPGAEQWSFVVQLLDFAWHLLLPVTVMSVGPLVLVARFVRDSVARAAQAPFVVAMRGLGIDARVVRRRLLRHGFTPVATLAGSLLPMLVGGSIVVENLFALDGLGHLAYQAVAQQDQPLLMTLVTIGSIVTLASLLLSDVLHRAVDPRVRLLR